MTVAEWLTLARQAHEQYRSVAGAVDKQGRVVQAKDHDACRAALMDAITARGFALAADPDMADAAWDGDRALMRGVSNDALLAFYDVQLSKL